MKRTLTEEGFDRAGDAPSYMPPPEPVLDLRLHLATFDPETDILTLRNADQNNILRGDPITVSLADLRGIDMNQVVNEIVTRQMTVQQFTQLYTTHVAPTVRQEVVIDFVVAASDEESDLVTGPRISFPMPRDIRLTAVKAMVSFAPQGGSIIVDVLRNGNSIFSTPLSINAGHQSSTLNFSSPAVISQAAIAADDIMTIEIIQVGTAYPGAGLKITFLGTQP